MPRIPPVLDLFLFVNPQKYFLYSEGFTLAVASHGGSVQCLQVTVPISLYIIISFSSKLSATYNLQAEVPVLPPSITVHVMNNTQIKKLKFIYVIKKGLGMRIKTAISNDTVIAAYSF
jgi:hypothetical protein